MSDEAQIRKQVVDYLGSLEGKGVETLANIAKAIGVHRRDLSKIINKMELEGVVQSAGVMAGVAGYKLKK